MPLRRAVDLDATRPQVRGGSVQVGNLEFNMKGPAAVREQAQATLAEAQEREPAGHVEEHHRIRQTAIELQPPIHIRDMQREPHQRNSHWASTSWHPGAPMCHRGLMEAAAAAGRVLRFAMVLLR